MKILFTYFFVMTFSLQSFALPVLHFSPEVSAKEKNSFLNVESNKYLSYSQFYLTNVPDSKNIDLLTQNFEQAQKYYLVKSYSLAQTFYKKVIALQDVDEWRDLQRKIIFTSFVRMAELDKSNQEDWLRKAIAFGPDLLLGDFNFEESILQKIKNLKKEMASNAIEWSIQSLQKDFSVILINGHVVDLKKFDNIKIPKGTYRITYVSDIFKPQTYKITSQQIPLIEPSKIPFVMGDCKNPQFNHEGEAIDAIAVYYSAKCIQYFYKNRWSKNLDFKNLKDLPEAVSIPNEISNYEIKSDVFYKKKWFWILTGAVVAGVLIHSASQKKDSKPASKTVSF